MFRIPGSRLGILSLQFNTSVTLGRSLTLIEVQFPNLKNGVHNR